MNAIVFSVIFIVSYSLLVTWAANNYKRSIKREYEEKLDKANLRSLAQNVHLSNLTETNKILLSRLAERGKDIEKLHAKINDIGVFRNAKGQFQRIEQ